MTTSSQKLDPQGRGGRGPRIPISTTVIRTERLSPTMVRVVVGGEDLRKFAMNDSTDAYVKCAFLHPGVEHPRPLDFSTLPPEQAPRLRTYTVRGWDQDKLELTIDFVVHGDEGLAGPWARDAKPGDELLILGPGGGYAPDLSAGWHLFVGDESAIPAIANALGALPDGARGYVLIEVDGPEQALPLKRPAGVHVQWIHHGPRPIGEALLSAVAALDFSDGDVQAFVHGEAGMVKDLRRLIKVDRGVPMDRLSISGYWRLGRDDEGWRSMKRTWNQEIEESEAGAR
jgi:NADPH-dependent ferric siderophore reductase